MQYHNFVDDEKDEDEDEAEAKGADSSGDICDEHVQYHKFVDEDKDQEDGMTIQNNPSNPNDAEGKSANAK